jgi:hypothetical protein
MRDEFATTPYKKGGCGSATIMVSNSCAVPRSALVSTQDPQAPPPPETLRFAPLNGCDADGSLEPTAYRCRLFFVRMRLWSGYSRWVRPEVVIAMSNSRSDCGLSDTLCGYA